MEEVESHSHLPSITSYVFYLKEVEAACLAILRDCERGAGTDGVRLPGKLSQYLSFVEPPFHFLSI